MPLGFGQGRPGGACVTMVTHGIVTDLVSRRPENSGPIAQAAFVTEPPEHPETESPRPQ